jgi:hypothetical protein
MLTYAERLVARYLARCPVWQGHPVASIRRCATVTGLAQGEVRRAMARLLAMRESGPDMAAE